MTPDMAGHAPVDAGGASAALHDLVHGRGRESLTEGPEPRERAEDRILGLGVALAEVAVQDLEVRVDRRLDFGAEPDGLVGVVFAPFTSSRPFFVVMSLYRSFEASLRRRPS